MRLMLYSDECPEGEPIVDDGTIATEPGRSMSERSFYIDAALAEHSEIDCDDGGERRCESCAERREALREIAAEQERRARLGIEIIDADEPTLEERLGPYGLEWQLEQRERMEGRG